MADTATNLEVYKLLVEDVREARRARRELSNVFMTLNIAGMSALGFLASANGLPNPVLFTLCAIALALTCAIWRTSNSYYTVLLAAKYKNIYAIEDDLGVHPIRDEWQNITGKRRAMKWWSLERAMPILFIVGYAVFFAVQVGGWDAEAWFRAVINGVADLIRDAGILF
ncbi:MAG: hypothetical protein KF779_02330 [Hyphomonadaceae bacterium]|nr:hypothetical protein [Hyphomonadaceae bacterium]MCA8886903.1 hypothetical protein [Hyphomonadaceae bacterium]